MADDLTHEPQSPAARYEERLRAGAPRHFHLLWDEDLDDMHEILKAIRDRRDEVVSLWYNLYSLHFGESRSLSEAEFHRVFEPALLRSKNDLLEKKMDSYAKEVRQLGATLAERGVPLQEIIASLEFFEEAARAVFPEPSRSSVEAYATFDKLSHIRIILLVDAYFRLVSAATGTRIKELEHEAAQLPHDGRHRFHGIVGASAVMRKLYQRIEAAGHTNGTVLIVGESGTGKELVARALHELGQHHAAPFVALNCAAIPKDLIESELFGYKRGAFSGANTEYLGLFRAAEGGTLFLDEITEMGADTQAKLLRAIQERSVRPVGSTRETPVNVRLIASTNRDPTEAVRAHILRDDLYYRLQANILQVPPLRERLDDVPLLVEHFIALCNERLGSSRPVEGIEQSALGAMSHYDWPGNVRELANAIEGAMTFGHGPLIELDELPPSISGSQPTHGNEADTDQPHKPPALVTFAEVERDLIARALEASDWNKVQAAKLLKISRKKLYAKIAKYHLE